MNWLIVVIFATMTGDVYIFTEPEFSSREECMASVLDPEDQKGYVAKLTHEYGKVMPIRGVNCLQEDTIKKIIENHNNPDVKS